MITNWKVLIQDCTNLTKYISISVSALQITPAPDTDLLFGLEEVIYLLLQVCQLQLHRLLSLDGCRWRKLKVLQLKPVQVSSLLLKAKNGIQFTINMKPSTERLFVWKQDDQCFFSQTYDNLVKREVFWMNFTQIINTKFLSVVFSSNKQGSWVNQHQTLLCKQLTASWHGLDVRDNLSLD